MTAVPDLDAPATDPFEVARLAAERIADLTGAGRHDVGEHRGAAEPVALDDGHLGAELRGDERRLVPARATAEDHDPLCVTHAAILADHGA